MAVGDEEGTSSHKLTDTITANPFPASGDSLPNTSGLVTMETVIPGGEGGEVVGGMAQHNGLPGYSPPRERQDSEATLGAGEAGLAGGEGEEEEES